MNKGVIYLRLDKADKKILQLESSKLGMPLTTYCRMILLGRKSKGKNAKGVIIPLAGEEGKEK